MLDLNDGEYDLTIYVPTKGRPDNALRLQECFYLTSRIMSRIVFIISDNDEQRDHYKGLEDIIVVSPMKPGFVDPLNLGYKQDRRKVYSYALGFMGDDHLPRTVGWDEKFVSELLKLGSGFVYGNDGIQFERIPTHVVMTSDIPLTLDYMTYPALWHLYADNFWLDVGKKIGKISYLHDVHIEHMHPAANKAIHDKGYEFSGSHALDWSDKNTYQDYLDKELDHDVKRILSMMKRTGKL